MTSAGRAISAADDSQGEYAAGKGLDWSNNKSKDAERSCESFLLL